jgi:hypothetical protein
VAACGSLRQRVTQGETRGSAGDWMKILGASGSVRSTMACHVRWVPCHHDMARPQVADGGDGLQIWRIAGNILNKQSRTADKPRSSNLGGWAWG